MKKIVAIFFTAATIISCFSSCKKFLDVKPKGYTIPQFYEDYAKLMNNMSLIRVSSAYPNYLTDDVQAGDDNDVSKQASYTGLSDFKKNLYSFQPGAVFIPGSSDPLWEPAYSHIYTYNVVINNIMSVTDAGDTEKKQLRAEALFGRAFEYLTLVNAYAKHYNPATAATDLGVPIILSEDINATYKRNSVAEVYDRIKVDLEAALKDLPEKTANIFHPNRSVGFSFLSKMYLYMGKYDEALTNARAALALNSNLIDYTLYTTQNGVTFGRVCLISNKDTRFPDAQLSNESVWVRFGSSSSSSVNAEVYVSSDLLSVFSKNLPSGAVDQRKNLFFCDGVSNFGLKPVNFPGRVLYAPYIDFNLGLSSADMILIAAECEARVGDKDQAVKYLNTLRDKRIKNNQQLAAATKDDALNLVLEERRRELCFIGCNRLIDLKRLNMDTRLAKTITHTQGTKTWSLPPNDNRYILPVPPKTLEFNSGMPLYER
ncbi:SusD-like starch-binding protein associating with outer membrane [Chitinophaga dinghuensis]|uniref:SusD-like starch-binding protein associating with outer membrane n=1 Tax=Chitinophaga dinghuensis TaxID=1539050 RepID=A0A327VJW0_9BACT|nr:RagB/SusD family nutrient uptake outer membrane protein [Chitinophaga dinghuensis]RAJ73465.1 SusD-like starch-binding protein associating with outer membrane [Chitinophaga dinghuensis]